MIKFFPSIFWLALFAAFPAFAFDIPPNDGFVTDITGVLSVQEENQIEVLLQEYGRETSNEIAVLIINSLEGEDIADTAFEIGRTWGIGTKEKDNGILFLIAIEDRELFLATGYGLEGAVPDIVAKGIIDEYISPYFKDEDYAGGILAGIDALKKHIGGEYTADRYENGTAGDWPWEFVVFIGFILFQWIISILGRTKSWWLGGVVGAFVGIVLTFIFAWWWSIPLFAILGLILDFLVSRNYKSHRGKASWWAGGGGKFGGGSGGFGGFGGGSFGGGGAGGRW